MEQTETDKKQTKRVKLKSESELSSSLNKKFCMRKNIMRLIQLSWRKKNEKSTKYIQSHIIH